MGLYFRKSISLGHGIRLNVSKKGIGISAGVKGFRVSTGPNGTRVTSSIPGTGIYYTERIDSTPHGIVWDKGSSSNNSRTRSDATQRNFPYQQTVYNSYTGETRTVTAATSWELNSLVAAERQRQDINEQRQKALEHLNSQNEAAQRMTNEAVQLRQQLGHLIQDTLAVNDELDWKAQLLSTNYAEFKFDEQPPQRKEPDSPSGLRALFHRTKAAEIDAEYDQACKEYTERKKQAYRGYVQEKELYEKTARAHNAEILFLKESFEDSETSAIEKYASIILSNSKYPSILDLDFDIKYQRNGRILEVDCLLPWYEDLPIVERYQYSSYSSSFEPTNLSSMKIQEFYSNLICSIALRTTHELYEAIYTKSVDRILFNGYVPNADVEGAFADIDFESMTHCIISSEADRETFERLNLLSAPPKELLENLSLRLSSRLLSSDSSVEPRRL